MFKTLVAAALTVLSAGASQAMALDKNIDAIRAAIDPTKGAPVVEPIFPSHHELPALGGPGPYTPEAPARLGISGIAVIQCSRALSGKLGGCTLIADAPLHLNFGDAALRMAQTGYMTAAPPANFGGGEQVRIVVTFRVPRGGVAVASADLQPGSPTQAPTDAKSAQPPVTHPIWISLPTGQDFADVYPPKEFSNRVGAHLVMSCRVAADGGLDPCAMVTEQPPGLGFGDAGLLLATRFRMKPTDGDGLQTAGRIFLLKIRFVPPS